MAERRHKARNRENGSDPATEARDWARNEDDMVWFMHLIIECFAAVIVGMVLINYYKS